MPDSPSGLAYHVKVGSNNFDQSNKNGLKSTEVTTHIDMVGMAKMVFEPGGVEFSEIKPGDVVEIEVGSANEKVFVGKVASTQFGWKQGRQSLTVVAYCPLIQLASSRVTKVYEDKTDSDIVTAVLSDAGVDKGTVDSTSAQNKYVLQRNESNLAFCKRLATRNGYLLRSREGKVDFVKLQVSGTAKNVNNSAIGSVHFAVSTTDVPTEVVVSGWDPSTKKQVKGTADQAKVQSIGAGKNAVQAAASSIWKAKTYIADVEVRSDANANAMAESEINRLSRTYMRGTAILTGLTVVTVGEKVKFAELPAKYKATGLCIGVTYHLTEGRPMETEVSFVGNTEAE